MPLAADPVASFVKVDGRRFVVDGAPYAVCGTNLWYGALLGRPSNPTGRARLLRELDRLQQLGVNNLRVLGASEACDVPGSLAPAIQTAPGQYDEDLLQGLDYLVAEAGRRGMYLVVFLNNFWDWSGGMPQYLAWATGEDAVGVNGEEWSRYNATVSRYYTNPEAQTMNRDFIAMLLARTNTVTGRRYADEPAIMAWELANEPRPGDVAGREPELFAAFLKWTRETAGFIHSLDPKHLVTTGSEGAWGCAYSDAKFRQVHALPEIDYACFHLWPKNWSWFDVERPEATIAATLTRTRDYVLQHLKAAASLEKPVVCEEFGLDRDGGLGAEVPTTCRDRFFAEVFTLIEASRQAGGAAAGTNFWLWGGEGRPPEFGDSADGIGVGDMLQEEPGRNTVLDRDASTLAILRGHFMRLRGQDLAGVPSMGGLGKAAYLTIDDGPTPATPDKLSVLESHGIPAILFCTGQALEGHRAIAVDAIRRGFIIANHSYGHPFFSRTTLEQCREEIRRTDRIIDEIYKEAGVVRPARYFRFPYLDKGALTGSETLAVPSAEGAMRKEAIQHCLRELGYSVPKLPGVRWPSAVADDADWSCTYDVKEWSIAQPYVGTDVRTVADVFARMDRVAPAASLGLNSATGNEVILLHDHAETDEIFAPIVARLRAKGLRFVLPEEVTRN